MLVHGSSCVSYVADHSIMHTMLEDGLDELDDNPLHAGRPADHSIMHTMLEDSLGERDDTPMPQESTTHASQKDQRRSERVADRTARVTEATQARAVAAAAAVDDCGIRNRERRLGRGGRVIPMVEVWHEGQWRWLTWERYWKGPRAW